LKGEIAMMKRRVRADIALTEQGIRVVDLVVPKGHREDAFRFFEQILPDLKALDRTVTTVQPEGSR
jgi:hypothetical protein